MAQIPEFIGFQVDPQSATGFFAAVSAVARFPANMKELLQPLYDEWFVPMELEQFTTEGARGPGGTWTPLNTDYARRKADKYGNLLIEQLSGDLGLSLTNKDAPGAIYRVTEDNALEYGSSIAYAHAQHAGNPNTNLPSRLLIDPGDADLERALTIIARVFGNFAAAQGLPPAYGAGE